jgi:hypothetical protein
MKIAFMIQAHKDTEQIKLLVNSLTTTCNHTCFIHIDKKSECVYNELKSFYSTHVNVYICDNRFKVYWSHISQVYATLQLMKEVKKSSRTFDRIHLMSAEDFPMKRLEDIEAFLSTYKHKEFLEFTTIDAFKWRVKRYNFLTGTLYNRSVFIRTIQKALRIVQQLLPERNILRRLVLYKGSSWFNISRDAMKYILEFIEQNPSYIKSFKYSACGDEHFFHILLLNSEFKERVINNNLYYLQWTSNNSPAYLSYETIKQASLINEKFFARKVNEYTTKKLASEYNIS